MVLILVLSSKKWETLWLDFILAYRSRIRKKVFLFAYTRFVKSFAAWKPIKKFLKAKLLF